MVEIARVALPPVVAVLLALPTFSIPYILDDYDFLQRGGHLEPRDLLPHPSALFYRPVSRELYFACLQAVDPNKPIWGHIGNALLLALVVALFGSVTTKLFGRRAGFFAGLFFALLGALPVLVGWVSCAQDLLALAGALAALRLQLGGKTIAGLIACGLAILSKETAVAFVPAIVLLPRLAGVDPPRLRRDLLLYGGLVLVWALIHPGMRQLAANQVASGGAPRAYIGFGGFGVEALLVSAKGSILTLLNLPSTLPGLPAVTSLPSPVWVAGLVAAFLVILSASAVTRATPAPGKPGGREAAAVVLLAVPPLFATAVLVRDWMPYYAIAAAPGTSILCGAALARLSAPAATLALISFLGLGIGYRGMSIAPSIPTEPALRSTGEQVRRAEAAFRAVLPDPTRKGPVELLVQAEGGTPVYVHLFRFQIPRVWYRNPSIDTIHPEWRRPGPRREHLLAIDPALNVHEVDPATLRVRSSSPTATIGANTLLRSYAQGLAATGEVDRAAALLVALREGSPYAAAYNRRLAAAFLLAESRPADAARLLQGLPPLDPAAAVEAAGGTLANPLRREIDVPVLTAMGIPPDDPDAVRAMMRWFTANDRIAPARRFAQRLLRLSPGDRESMNVMGLKEGEQERVLVPAVPDSLW